MSEVRPTISQLLLTHPDRVAVDECLEVMRQNEISPLNMLSEDPYEMNRDASRYVTVLLGIQHLFDYVEQAPIPKMVLG